MRHDTGSDQQGFTLLEIALALAILSVLSFYLLDMVEFVKQRVRRLDDRERMELIAGRIRAYYLGQERLPPPDGSNRLPTQVLSLDQAFRYDRHGRFFLYLVADTINGFQVDGTRVAGVLISAGPDQLPDRNYSGATTFSTTGDDLILPLDVTQEAIEITLHELEVLSKRVEAYDRFFAGVDNNELNLYNLDQGDPRRETLGVPPIIDPDYYNQYYEDIQPDTSATEGKFPELYPYKNYYENGTDAPAPTWIDILVQQTPNNWPSTWDWSSNVTTQVPNQIQCDFQDPDPPSNYELPFFSCYGLPRLDVVNPPVDQAIVDDSYELIDEDGCGQFVSNGCFTATGDPSCGRITLDNCDPEERLDSLLDRYGLGEKYKYDSWNTLYQWGRGLDQADRRYRTFYSAGPDGAALTGDDITLF